MTLTRSAKKEIPSAFKRIRTYELLISNLNSLPLSYRLLVKSLAIKLGQINKGGKFLKELWCCIGGRVLQGNEKLS